MTTYQKIALPFCLGVLLSVALVVAFKLGQHYAPDRPDLPVNVQTDTLVIRDTIREKEPVFLTKYVDRVELVPVTDTIRRNDTLWQPVDSGSWAQVYLGDDAVYVTFYLNFSQDTAPGADYDINLLTFPPQVKAACGELYMCFRDYPNILTVNTLADNTDAVVKIRHIPGAPVVRMLRTTICFPRTRPAPRAALALKASPGGAVDGKLLQLREAAAEAAEENKAKKQL